MVIYKDHITILDDDKTFYWDHITLKNFNANSKII